MAECHKDHETHFTLHLHLHANHSTTVLLECFWDVTRMFQERSYASNNIPHKTELVLLESEDFDLPVKRIF